MVHATGKCKTSKYFVYINIYYLYINVCCFFKLAQLVGLIYVISWLKSDIATNVLSLFISNIHDSASNKGPDAKMAIYAPPYIGVIVYFQNTDFAINWHTSMLLCVTFRCFTEF